MNIKKSTWCLFLFLALISIGIWFKFSYPHFSSINLSIDRKQALDLARKYLKEARSEDLSDYRTAILFITNTDASHYLQKTLGLQGEETFLRKHNFDLFLWVIRFFRENEKEEFRLSISAATGEVTAFRHLIKETDARKKIGQEIAKKKAIDFLKRKFNFSLENYTWKGQLQNELENRTEYIFTWMKKTVNIPWDKAIDAGTAKLLIGATVAGEEILGFSKAKLDIPEKFYREEARKKQVSAFLSTVFFVFYLLLLTAATFFVILRRNHLVMHLVKNALIGLAVILFLLTLIDSLNNFQYTLFEYKTTSSLNSYLWIYALRLIISAFLVSISILMPGLSGESLHAEQFPEKKEGELHHYLVSSFFSRKVSSEILLGYLTCLILLGIQSLSFRLGREFFGVWVEHHRLTQISSSYLPFLAVFILAFKAAVSEEILFRVFAISWVKKLTNKTSIAAFVASILWGFGHSNYPVFPMWFRGIEVSLLGLFFSYVYIRFGLVPVIIAHYLFDVFWGITAYLFGKGNSFNLLTSLIIFLLPLGWAFISFILNKSPEENPMRWKLNRHQIFNIKVLTTYLANRREDFKNKSSVEIKKDLITHGWDAAVVEKSLEEISKKPED